MSRDKYRECELCTYNWIARVANPKSCPRCKRRFDYKEAEIVMKILGRKYGYNLLDESAVKKLAGVQNGRA